MLQAKHHVERVKALRSHNQQAEQPRIHGGLPHDDHIFVESGRRNALGLYKICCSLQALLVKSSSSFLFFCSSWVLSLFCARMGAETVRVTKSE
jgi:hypothetical protein